MMLSDVCLSVAYIGNREA